MASRPVVRGDQQRVEAQQEEHRTIHRIDLPVRLAAFLSNRDLLGNQDMIWVGIDRANLNPPKKVPGNPTRSYRSTAPLKIVGEVTGWVKQTPEEIQKWQ